MASHSSVGDCSFQVMVLAHNLSQRDWQNWVGGDEWQVSKGSFKFCEALLGPSSNSTLDKHITKSFAWCWNKSRILSNPKRGRVVKYCIIMSTWSKIIWRSSWFNKLCHSATSKIRSWPLWFEKRFSLITHTGVILLRSYCLQLWKYATKKRDLIVFF